MTAKEFVSGFVWINLPLLTLVCGLNYWIDGGSTHHLPGEASHFPRTSAHSAPSKLHYLSTQRIGTIFFGTSRVEVGLPPRRELVGTPTVYNAGLGGISMGQWSRFARHVIALSQPKNIVIGLEYGTFYAEEGDITELDLSLISSNKLSYLVKRIPYDLGHSISVKATQNSIRSIIASINNKPFDETIESDLGQLTAAKMQKIMEDGGQAGHFRHTLKLAFSKPSKVGSRIISDNKSWELFDSLLEDICSKGIKAKLFIHPQHALTIDAMRQNSSWSGFEQWKIDLAKLVTHYQSKQCDIKIIDFSGYNSITTDPIRDRAFKTSLHYYWEFSHYKSNVGELILKRLFSPSDKDLPYDFGRELRSDTVADVLATIREEQLRYVETHTDEIELAQKLLSEKAELKMSLAGN